jgi:hypothetical protein
MALFASRLFQIPADPGEARPRRQKERFVLTFKTCNVPDPLCPAGSRVGSNGHCARIVEDKGTIGLGERWGCSVLILDGIPSDFRRQGALE